jgi:hypothetical protein
LRLDVETGGDYDVNCVYDVVLKAKFAKTTFPVVIFRRNVDEEYEKKEFAMPMN